MRCSGTTRRVLVEVLGQDMCRGDQLHALLSQGLTDITSALLALHRTVQLHMATRLSTDDVSALVVALISALGQVCDDDQTRHLHMP